MGAQQSAAGEKLQQQDQQQQQQNGQLPLYSYSDIAAHKSPGDCWIIIHGFVYDVTSFLRSHPGGQDALLEVGGVDGSSGFDLAFHPEYVREDMEQYLVGRVDKQSLPVEDARAAATADEAVSSGSALTAEQQKQADEAAAAAAEADDGDDEGNAGKTCARIKFIYGSQRGAGQRFADRLAEACEQLSKQLNKTYLKVSTCPMNSFDPEDLNKEEYVVFIVSTYTDGTPPDSAKFFCSWLEEGAVDFRVGEGFMNKVTYAVLGLGNSLYDHNYNVVAKRMAEQLPALGGTLLCDLGACDESVSRETAGSAEEDFVSWMDNQFLTNLVLALEQPKAFAQKVAIAKSKLRTAARAAKRAKILEQKKKEREQVEADLKNAPEAEDVDSAGEAYSDEEDEESPSEGEDEGDAGDEEGAGSDGEKVVDLEELGSVLTKQKQSAQNKKDGSASSAPAEKPAPRPMLTDQLRKNLTKQGYKLIGSHSGVKLCRWTKAMLRGRGGCYKHTMYGIISYQCMELTPSLACANKCVFCWRTHTNPVGREWRWQVDEPRMILDNAIVSHRAMVNVMKGVPGVVPERLADAQMPRHCALSLVGEPIMYPHINQFVRMLHEENISSFLVTNAQFPKEMIAMDPVCQLYVSIDAATRDALKAVDRPLFSDYWERFTACLEALKHKKQRTVYRMTLVKTFNMQEVIEYAKLVSIGRPTFIEIKGVTFCGKSDAGQVTMKDVPLHEEVKTFGEQLCKYLEGNYEMASEHEHSCCILISDTKLKKNGKWHTWIDYPKFNQLIREYYATGKEFSAEDYGAETPAWATYGAKEKGFSPYESKVSGKSKNARPTLEELNAKYPGVNEKVLKAQQDNIKLHMEAKDVEAASSSSSSSAAVVPASE